MTGPAEELRTAAAKLRKEPPAVHGTPRLVQGDSETASAIAWCDHDKTEHDQCGDCFIVELHAAAVAALVMGMLQAREPLADWLDDVRSTYRPLLRAVAEGKQAEPDKGEIAHALTLARLINGGGA